MIVRLSGDHSHDYYPAIPLQLARVEGSHECADHTPIRGEIETPALVLRFFIAFHVAPLSVLRLSRISWFPGVLSFQTTYTFELKTAT